MRALIRWSYDDLKAYRAEPTARRVLPDPRGRRREPAIALFEALQPDEIVFPDLRPGIHEGVFLSEMAATGRPLTIDEIPGETANSLARKLIETGFDKNGTRLGPISIFGTAVAGSSSPRAIPVVLSWNWAAVRDLTGEDASRTARRR